MYFAEPTEPYYIPILYYSIFFIAHDPPGPPESSCDVDDHANEDELHSGEVQVVCGWNDSFILTYRAIAKYLT